ncbi:MAG: polysaccharide deacetylase, partial [Lachnospiraceae bacterium]|nr:polysaccharide deacetylase [Lachnospiraceae bacterium]
MAQSDAEQEAELAKRKRIRRLRNLIIFVPLSTILVLLITCIFLGISLYITKKELHEAKSAIEAAAGGTQTVSVDNTQASGDPLLYTTIGVDEFERTRIDGEDQSEENTGIRKVYLTFDDGPSSNTNRILDILAEYDVKATFFVVGKEEEGYQALYKRIVDEGHTLAMHSYSHKYNEIYQSLESYSADLSKLQEFLYDTTGVWCRYCRFPGGSSNTVSRVDMHELIAYLDEQDMSYFDWNISSGDAMSSSISPEEIIRNCTAKLKNYDEAIILMHDASEKNSTVRA